MGLAGAHVTVRTARADESEFLFRVYADSRADELAPVPWSDEQKEAFLRQQFHAQDTAYRHGFVDAAFSVIELGGVPIGRLYVADLDGADRRIVDIALLSEHRNHGIGTGLLRDIIEGADAGRMKVSLHVERWNPALRLYQRLGFHEVDSDDVYVRMERDPADPTGPIGSCVS